MRHRPYRATEPHPTSALSEKPPNLLRLPSEPQEPSAPELQDGVDQTEKIDWNGYIPAET